MAEQAVLKAIEVKTICQGADFPNCEKYEEVFNRIGAKLKAAEAAGMGA